MALARATELKQLGFDAGFWGIDDVTKVSGDKTALDEFLESHIWDASHRLIDWIGGANYDAASAAEEGSDQKKVVARAELLLAVAEILPVAWLRAGAGEESISFEGMSIRMARVSDDEKDRTLQGVIAKAERLVAKLCADVSFGGIESV